MHHPNPEIRPRRLRPYDQGYEQAAALIKNARELTHVMMDEGCIAATD